MSHFTDYHRHSWTAIHSYASSYWQDTVRRFPYMLIVAGIFGLVSYYFAYKQHFIKQYQVFFIYLIISFITLIIINTITYYLNRARGAYMESYTISASGVTINNKEIHYHSLNQGDARKHLGKAKKSKNPTQPIPLRTRWRLYTLNFDHKKDRTQAISSLSYYLKD